MAGGCNTYCVEGCVQLIVEGCVTWGQFQDKNCCRPERRKNGKRRLSERKKDTFSRGEKAASESGREAEEENGGNLRDESWSAKKRE